MQYNNANRLCADFLIYEQADGINHVLAIGWSTGHEFGEMGYKYTNSNNGGVLFWKNKINLQLSHWVG